ncbi:MAG: DNA topoisomerase 4 subunit A [Polyangiaceae bacterium]|nr:DNA topoisomerase 4 subunit A [Polyangiaceae bacterium]
MPVGGGAGGAKNKKGKAPPADEPPPPAEAPLHDLAKSRYLNYALSVITSRALPDVRDGLKPVQRRILYTMWQAGITADRKHRKCASVVGDVMGQFHPHGDSAIYDALVRMAQPFSLRAPLVDGSGNFGSLDGDPPAAYRYTECRLAPIAGDLLAELDEDTVHFRPNYDGTRTEPVVLPARLPNLLVNGATGIAVGMATNVPPHHPGEVCAAALRLLEALVEGRQLTSRELARTVKGPDFPTGGQIVSSAEEIKQVYETGQGSLKVRATWRLGPESRAGKTVVVDSIPYAVNKATLVESLAEIVISRKMPLLLDVRDVSADDVRIELTLKKDADERKVMAYLFRHTALQSTFAVNLTCLVPTENPEVGRPERLDLASLLWHFLHFRLEVVTRRLQHELGRIERRMHVLEGFEKVFDALDTILKIVRASDGKADAASKIMSRFALDAEQTDAILELKIYRLAKLEILVIRQELEEKRKRKRELEKLLGASGARGRWGIVRRELTEIGDALAKASPRRTTIVAVEGEAEFSEEELIVAEDAHVLLTRDGWIKRQKEIRDPAATRLREGDQVLACVAGSTRATLVLFSSLGSAYTTRVTDVPATTGHGEPVQKLFKLRDGETIVTMLSLDPRVVGDVAERGEQLPRTFAVAATTDGYVLAFGLAGFVEPSTRSGRRFARVADGARVLGVYPCQGGETLLAASRQRRAIVCGMEDVSYLGGPGRGVLLLKLAKDDELMAFGVATHDRTALVLETSLGGEQRVSAGRFKRVGRGGKGHEVMSRGQLVRWVQEPPPAPAPLEAES